MLTEKIQNFSTSQMLITINYQFIYSKNPLKVLKVIDKEKSDTNKKYSIQIEKSDFFIFKKS